MLFFSGPDRAYDHHPPERSEAYQDPVAKNLYRKPGANRLAHGHPSECGDDRYRTRDRDIGPETVIDSEAQSERSARYQGNHADRLNKFILSQSKGLNIRSSRNDEDACNTGNKARCHSRRRT